MNVRKLLLVVPIFLSMVVVTEAQTVTVTADRTSLRDKPSVDGAIVASLVKGDELSVIEKAGTWYRVRARSSGQEGYVSTLLVEVSAGAAPPTSPTPVTPAANPASPVPSAPARVVQSSPPQGNQQPQDRTHFIRVLGGLVTGYGDAGFLVGGGVGVRPFGNEAAELAFDALYGRSGETAFGYNVSTSVLGISGNFLYNFQLEDQGFTPYAGLGIIVSRATLSSGSPFNIGRFDYSGTFSALQLTGGIEKAISDKRAFRGEFRTGFASYGSSLVLLAGLSF